MLVLLFPLIVFSNFKPILCEGREDETESDEETLDETGRARVPDDPDDSSNMTIVTVVLHPPNPRTEDDLLFSTKG